MQTLFAWHHDHVAIFLHDFLDNLPQLVFDFNLEINFKRFIIYHNECQRKAIIFC